MAEEVVQETFLALWNRADRSTPQPGSLAAWLHTIARNRAIDRLRAAGRRPPLVAMASSSGSDEDAAAALDRLVAGGTVVAGSRPAPAPGGGVRCRRRAARRSATRSPRCPSQERTVILLAYQDELSQSEIAERLGWPLGTVKTRTRRALLRLREALGTGVRPGRAGARSRCRSPPARIDKDTMDHDATLEQLELGGASSRTGSSG